MNNNNTTFSQKIKDNAFYIALGVGILAIIAVIAVYTMGRDNGAYEENEIDLNQPYDFSSLTDGVDGSGSVNKNRKDNAATVEENRMKSNKEAVENIPDTKAKDKMQQKNVQVTDRSMIGEKDTSNDEPSEKESDNKKSDEADILVEDNKLPVTADVGELNFGSGKTLAWPVKGEVILPYSMETTLYYKTLDQYKTNPGMLIACGSGSTVKNAYLGKVVNVTSDNTYGNMVTVYVGNDYSIVYGQLDTIYVKEGDYIKAGDSIGTIGKPTDSFEDEGSHLFFEVLYGDDPVDPMEFMDD